MIPFPWISFMMADACCFLCFTMVLCDNMVFCSLLKIKGRYWGNVKNSFGVFCNHPFEREHLCSLLRVYYCFLLKDFNTHSESGDRVCYSLTGNLTVNRGWFSEFQAQSYLYTSTMIIRPWKTMKELASFPLPLCFLQFILICRCFPYWPSFVPVSQYINSSKL